MDDHQEALRISQECRRILGDPSYSPELVAELIKWLKHPSATVSDIAGRCLIKLGDPANDDLFNYVVRSGELPWPNAVWVLGEVHARTDRLVPYLRTWIEQGSENLQRQCAVSLAHILVAQKRRGTPPDADDVELCDGVLYRYWRVGATGIHLRDFRAGMKEP